MNATTPKTLVIGSTSHAHVACVEWDDIDSVNLVDFHQVVVNCRPLTANYLSGLKYGFFDKTRYQFARLLESHGQIVAIGVPTQHGENKSGLSPHDTYSWSPVAIETVKESGDTIEILVGYFGSYLTKLERWESWYHVPSKWLTHEMQRAFGNPGEYEFALDMQSIATNRYGSPLALGITPKVGRMTHRGTEEKRPVGQIILLPDIPELDSREATNLVLEDLLGVPQTTLPPDWATALVVPGMTELAVQIETRVDAIETLESEIATLEGQMSDLARYRKLLYASGPELEQVFSSCLERLGGTITPARYSQEEFVLDFEGVVSLVECKGVSKSATLAHVRQLTDYMDQYEEEEKVKGRGVLFVNAWRNLALQERGHGGTPIFPPNVIDRAEKLGIALVSSVDFFHAVCQVLEGKIEGATILRRLATTNGVVNCP